MLFHVDPPNRTPRSKQSETEKPAVAAGTPSVLPIAQIYNNHINYAVPFASNDKPRIYIIM